MIFLKKTTCKNYFISEKIKWSCKVLRFFCHLYGFNLAFTKNNDEKLQTQISSLIKTTASDFFSEMKIKHSIDHLQPIFVEFGKDSFEDIGEPKINKSSDGKLKSMWEDTLLSTFKDYNQKDNTLSNFDEKFLLLKYPEKILDADLIQFE